MRRSLAVASVVLCLLAIGITHRANAQTVVVPNANATAPGNTDNRFPFLVNGGMRYQQVYAASQFSSLGGPELITGMTLRNGIFVNQAFTSTIPNIQIDLSTVSTAPDALSGTFANNVGANDTKVFGAGSLTLSSTNAAGPGGTKVFDVVINFATPFLYNPAAGNLLLDVRNFSGANSSVNTDFFDAVNHAGDSVSRIYGPEGNEASATGTADSLGLITQFTFSPAASVPEPSSLALFLTGGLPLVGFVAFRRRRV